LGFELNFAISENNRHEVSFGMNQHRQTFRKNWLRPAKLSLKKQKQSFQFFKWFICGGSLFSTTQRVVLQ